MRPSRFGSIGLGAAAIIAALAGTGLNLHVMDGSRVAKSGNQGVDNSGKGTLNKSVRAELRSIFGSGWARGSGDRRMPGTGWSVATDRRRAKKARNVARNRAAHR